MNHTHSANFQLEEFNLEELLYKIYLRSPQNLFDEFMDECNKFYEAPVHSFSEMRRRDNKKLRGDIFEEFCALYMKHIKKYDNVYLLKKLPENIRTQLGLSTRDMGIDLVVEKNGEYSAVQCKYRKRDKYRNMITWKTLSTFYALCLRTGPWVKYIVFTNCDYVTHQGKKNSNDLSICIQTLRSITQNQWLSMCNLTSHTLKDTSSDTSLNIQVHTLIDSDNNLETSTLSSNKRGNTQDTISENIKNSIRTNTFLINSDKTGNKQVKSEEPNLDEIRRLRLLRFS